MAHPEPRPAAGLGSEDRLHRILALFLGAVAGAVVLTRAFAPPEAAAPGEPAPTRASDAPSREALEAAIAELTRWFERGTPRTPLDTNLRLLALGRAAVDAAPGREGAAALVWKNLEGSSRLPALGARPAALVLGTQLNEREASADATLAILLEAGVPLDAELPLAAGAASPRQLLALATTPGVSGEPVDPWTLDLLSFAVLAGKVERRGELERATLASLGRLEREQRPLTALMGDGAPAAEALRALAEDLRRQRAAGATWSHELRLAAAVFRAVAVLTQPDLEQRALRHLNALLFRHQIERDLRQQALARAQTPAERIDVRLEAVEALGRLEQALYGAHLAFRREDRPGPSPRSASSMRRAAGDLLEQLEALQQDGAFAASDARRAPGPEALARAAAQALRGLRAARISI